MSSPLSDPTESLVEELRARIARVEVFGQSAGVEATTVVVAVDLLKRAVAALERLTAENNTWRECAVAIETMRLDPIHRPHASAVLRSAQAMVGAAFRTNAHRSASQQFSDTPEGQSELQGQSTTTKGETNK